MTDTAPRILPAETVREIRPPDRAKAPRIAAQRKRSLTKELQSSIEGLGTIVYVLDPFDGAAIHGGAEPLARALNDLAKDSDVLYRFLTAANRSTKWGALALAVGGIALPILSHHGLLPLPIPSSMMPEVPDVDD